MLKRFDLPLAAATVLALSYVPANAADAIYDVPPAPAAPVYESVAPLPTWTGVYAGVTLGYGWGDSKVRANNLTVGIDNDGFAAGVFGGAQYQFDSFVVGAETDIGYNWNEEDDGVYEARTTFDGSLRARLGYAATDRVLLYGTAGLAYARAEVDGPVSNDKETLVGWTAGAGVDVKLTEMVFGRAEYRYTDYGDKNFDVGPGVNVDSKQSKVMFGLGVHF